ncbi:hypothetical protein MYXO_03803 [Myxococcaceae bacterium]|nr:hypothetical protein MYXO_03803 [Myxococcaceae bacterium]
MRRHSRHGRGLVTVLVVALCLGASARAEEVSEEDSVGYGIGAALLSVVYGPAKVVYAGLGSLVGAAAWAVTGGDTEVSTPIFESALYGDYVVTPEHLEGERGLEFVGRPSDTDRSVASPSDGF